MPISFNKDIFNKYKALSIQNANEINIGDHLYSNSGVMWEKAIIVAELITDKQFYKRLANTLNASESFYKDKDDTEILWLIHKDNNYTSLRDRNVGASYNPYLLFKDKDIAQQCKEELIITFTK